MHVAGFVTDRNILAWPKWMGSEMIAGLAVMSQRTIIVENPPRVFRPTWFVNQFADILVVAPEPLHPAMLAIYVP